MMTFGLIVLFHLLLRLKTQTMMEKLALSLITYQIIKKKY